jgi:transposase-like protein
LRLSSEKRESDQVREFRDADGAADMPDPDAASAEVAHDIEHLTSEILRRWRRRLRRRGDDRARSGDRGESERLLVAALLRASSSRDDTMLPGLAAAAAQFGAGQRRDRLDPGGLCEELSCLRQLVWSELKSQEASVHDAVDRILRFDRALSIVVKAAVTAGYAEATLIGKPPCSDE